VSYSTIHETTLVSTVSHDGPCMGFARISETGVSVSKFPLHVELNKPDMSPHILLLLGPHWRIPQPMPLTQTNLRIDLGGERDL